MASFWQDVRYGLRVLAKNPAFTVVAVLTLALGIGANTAIFSAVNAVLLRPFAFEDPDRLVVVWEAKPSHGLDFMVVSSPNYVDWRQQNRVFDDMAAYRIRRIFLLQEAEPLEVQGVWVTASLFDVLKIAPLIGRTFTPEEDQPGRGQVVLLSHGFWQRILGSDPAIVGKTLVFEAGTYTVVGVMPPEFNFPPPISLEGPAPAQKADLWAPFPYDLKNGGRAAHNLFVIARLKSGVTLETADAEMKILAKRLEQDYPDTNEGWTARLTLLDHQVLGEVRRPLLVLLAAVGFVLLIACVNVANLLLVRGTARQKELAIRAAQGASRFRLIRHLLTENLALAFFGGGAGLLLAHLGIRFLLHLAPQNVPRLEETTIDLTVIGFTLVISFLTGALFGLVPALQSPSAHLNEWLKEGGRTAAHGSGSQRLKGALVVVEVALSLVLLIGAGLLFKSFLNLRGVDGGIRAENVLTLRMTLPRARFSEDAQRIAAFEELERRLNGLPGIQRAGFIYDIPLAADRQGTSILLEGEPPPAPDENRQVNFSIVTPGYFRSMGIPLLKGQGFTKSDTEGTPEVILINDTLARRYFPDEDPVGKRLIVHTKLRRIVGVLGDVHHDRLQQSPNPTVYAPYYQTPWSYSMSLAAWTETEPTAALADIRQLVREMDPSIPIYEVKTMDEVLAQSIAQPRFSTIMLSLFSVVALTLAAIGIYGVMSYVVSQRTQEIGIRMALGARRNDVLKVVLSRGLLQVLLGVVAGLAASLALTHHLSALLFGVTPTDPVTFVGVPLILTGVAVLACYIPARQATDVDPIVALRYE
jgi:putative ABC transport system permease protein